MLGKIFCAMIPLNKLNNLRSQLMFAIDGLQYEYNKAANSDKPSKLTAPTHKCRSLIGIQRQIIEHLITN